MHQAMVTFSLWCSLDLNMISVSGRSTNFKNKKISPHHTQSSLGKYYPKIGFKTLIKPTLSSPRPLVSHIPSIKLIPALHCHFEHFLQIVLSPSNISTVFLERQFPLHTLVVPSGSIRRLFPPEFAAVASPTSRFTISGRTCCRVATTVVWINVVISAVDSAAVAAAWLLIESFAVVIVIEGNGAPIPGRPA